MPVWVLFPQFESRKKSVTRLFFENNPDKHLTICFCREVCRVLVMPSPLVFTLKGIHTFLPSVAVYLLSCHTFLFIYLFFYFSANTLMILMGS